MEKEKYRVIFSGKTDHGKDIAGIKRNLAGLFKADVSKINCFFRGKKVVVKKNLDHPTALKYIRGLKKAGVICEIQSAESETAACDENKVARQIQEAEAEVKATLLKRIPNGIEPLKEKIHSAGKLAEKNIRFRALFTKLTVSLFVAGSAFILFLYFYQAELQRRKQGAAPVQREVVRGRIKKPAEPKQGEQISNSFGMEFVFLKAGTFTMGSPNNEPGRKHDENQCNVTLTKGFYLQTTEVTQGQWKAVMGNNPSYCKDCGENSPVERVSWNDVKEFIRKLNQMEGVNTYRLPTEAEWEFACRAGRKSAFSNGEIAELGCVHDSTLDAIGWYCGNSNGKTHPVAQKKPNAWGLFDMHGNVYEWCQDWAWNYPSASATDPKGPDKGSYRVLRGGSWDSNAKNCRSAHRGYYVPDQRDDRLGFRLLRDS